MLNVPPTTQSLLQREPAALDWFYRTHARTVLDWVRRLGGPGVNAEEVAHDAFMVAFKRIHTFRIGGSLKAWMYGIVRRVVANARRRAKLRNMIGLDQIPEARSGDTSSENNLIVNQERVNVLRTLQILKQGHREVLVLMDMEENTAPEVAEMLNIPIGTVYSRLHHARRAFLTAHKRFQASESRTIRQGRRT